MMITPLAAESLGVRSMAVEVSTPDVTILIDPGIALAPYRDGHPPHRKEQARQKKLWKSVLASARRADVLTISHYHFDHHEPERPSLYRGPHLFVKHPEQNINISQRGRAAEFLGMVEPDPADLEYADGRAFEFGKTLMEFSEAVPHGTNTKLGWVVQLAVSRGNDVFLHTSDVEGPSLDAQLDFILEAQPTVVACDGPMTYLMYKYGRKALERSLANLERIVRETPCKTLMLDHHLTRDLRWREKLAPVFEAGEDAGCDVITFAGFLGLDDDLLEANRKSLFKGSS